MFHCPLMDGIRIVLLVSRPLLYSNRAIMLKKDLTYTPAETLKSYFHDAHYSDNREVADNDEAVMIFYWGDLAGGNGQNVNLSSPAGW